MWREIRCGQGLPRDETKGSTPAVNSFARKNKATTALGDYSYSSLLAPAENEINTNEQQAINMTSGLRCTEGPGRHQRETQGGLFDRNVLMHECHEETRRRGEKNKALLEFVQFRKLQCLSPVVEGAEFVRCRRHVVRVALAKIQNPGRHG